MVVAHLKVVWVPSGDDGNLGLYLQQKTFLAVHRAAVHRSLRLDLVEVFVKSISAVD